ncbi:MAG: hypothetical protein UY63_C0016G0018 [Parcubacteria group bacterium GW2011_GWA2_51_10]|nr:MAG: hypothetical protein UY63_C0016G0018 [Parcubacteria group bacterium GW2011_GWA2_51_10]
MRTLDEARKSVVRSVRPWGIFYGWDGGQKWYLKTHYVNPGNRTSLQYHNRRSECWILVDGDATATLTNPSGKKKNHKLRLGQLFSIGKGAIHRFSSKRGGVIVEVAFGHFDEDDIVRLEDDYGRVKSKQK